jgi:hypothetical protein
MKGILFTEFLRFVDHTLGEDVVDRLEAEGHRGYISLDTYDPDRMQALVGRTAALVDTPPATLLCRFGTQLFGRFASLYPVFFSDVDSTIGFIAGIEMFVHNELHKLYGDVEFPALVCHQTAPGRLEMTYRSRRHLADLAEGLVRGCIAHFGDPIEVRREDLPPEQGEQVVRFTLVTFPTH